MSHRLQLLLSLILLGACSPSAGGDAGRGPLGKADGLGTCAGACGGQSDGECWCDDQCTSFGDCCADKAELCDGEGAPDAAPAADAGTAQPILKYGYGNQIVGSTLEIRADGVVTHTERICCPPTINDQPEPALDAASLAALVNDIAAVAAAGTETRDGNDSCLGCTGGSLVVRSDGAEHVVFAQTNDVGEHQTITSSTAPEAADIVDLVNDLVDQEIPIP